MINIGLCITIGKGNYPQKSKKIFNNHRVERNLKNNKNQSKEVIFDDLLQMYLQGGYDWILYENKQMT